MRLFYDLWVFFFCKRRGLYCQMRCQVDRNLVHSTYPPVILNPSTKLFSLKNVLKLPTSFKKPCIFFLGGGGGQRPILGKRPISMKPGHCDELADDY